MIRSCRRVMADPSYKSLNLRNVAALNIYYVNVKYLPEVFSSMRNGFKGKGH